MSSLAGKVDKLFTTIRANGREYTYEEVARGCSELSGGTFSKTYVWQLRTGQRTNPTKRHLEALAAFFRVPVAYFFDDDTADRVDSQLALASAMGNAEVRDIALRAMSMDDSGRKSLARIIREVSKMHATTAAARGRQPNEPVDSEE
ncbi:MULTISPECIES: helix-turn-helix transcriptional regulator [Streptomyces]|uniref:Nucleoid-associated protein EspR n=1 Tax=Streptomyces rimosus subsp. rimosus TaxID=132474 RepID=A0ABY3Z9L7_STRRM|nr:MULTISPECIES: helix-turn-helix transcriptional regulator [Streptomyces]KOG68664.1 XRE family transcriptional regulator [Kitasatospora aureofaciens]KEF05006.1 XRE family transcriptional regulator [Streptomyces rimosus]KEF21944.1 XRE family transcriptional regulator [Streptomyces rimosus]KOT35586.1 XRE family transcriptional regulator [Streptomyces rimosus subsp. rimosus]KOT36841.1 XRE family transcriptional regulator [Streptomyces sp. NRRL WC-3701]